jgi:hypothetical protein
MALRLRDALKREAGAADRQALARHLAALRALDEAREGVATNANPQLALAALARDLERVA